MNRLSLVRKAAHEREEVIPPGIDEAEKVSLAGLNSADRNALCWGYAAISSEALAWILPSSFAGIAFDLAIVLAIGFSALMLRRPNTRWPASALLSGVLLLQMWSIVCALYADRVLGRPMTFNRANLIWLDAMIPFFAAWFTISIQPSAAFVIRRIIIASFVTSSVFAWLQFARLGPALTLSGFYTYKSIDNWDGHPGIRAVGLTMQPNQMAFQATMALALLAAPVLWRRLTRGEFVGILLVSGAAVFTQARIGYIGVVLLWAVLIVLTIKRDRKQATWLAALAVACLVIGAATAMKRFDYIISLSGSNGPDYSLQYRQDVTWAQLNPIYPKLWVTGVGPSDGLLMGSGYEDKYVPMGGVMESEYLVTLAMYGVPGLIFLCLTLLGSFLTYVIEIIRPATNARRCMLAAAAVGVLLVAINGYSFNTIDNYLMLPCLLLFGGAAANPVATRLGEMRKAALATRNTRLKVR